MRDDIEGYVGVNLIAYITINPNYQGNENKQCWMHPIYVQTRNSNKYIKINNPEEIFPPIGAITINLKNGSTADDLADKKYYTIRINQISDPIVEGTNYYSTDYNKQMGKIKSNIWIEAFSLSKYSQIIACSDTPQDISVQKAIDLPLSPIRTSTVLLDCGDQYFGPFSYEINDSSIKLSARREQGYFAGIIGKSNLETAVLNLYCENDLLNLDLVNIDIKKITQVTNKIDFITDEQLIAEINRTLKEYDRGKKDKKFNQSFRNDIMEALNASLNDENECQLSEDRLLKIKKILTNNEDQIAGKKEMLNDMAYLILEDRELDSKIVNIILEEQPDKILKNGQVQNFINNNTAILEEQKDGLKKEIQASESEKRNLEMAIKKLKIEKEQETEKIIQNKKQDINTLEKRIDCLKEEITKQNSAYDEWVKRIDKKKNDYNNIIHIYKNKMDEYKNNSDVIEKIVDKDLLEQTMQIIHYPTARSIQEKSIEKNIPMIVYDDNLNIPQKGNEIIDNIKKYLDKNNRSLERNEVINLLICFTQGFITTFAGEPGTGKTSLCRLFAKALGLEKAERYTELSVERGWNSSKDYIGYYNPLTGQLEQSNSEILSALQTLDKEVVSDQEKSQTAPYIVLLDEANLSPIEHYWANFLRICDDDSCYKRIIDLGGNYKLRIPQSLRFLATVNFDQTTEELSPRFLDRSWVIMLTPKKVRIEDESPIMEDNSKIVSCQLLEHLFDVSFNIASFDDSAMEQKWEKILNIYQDSKNPISPRDNKMIMKYCSVANKYMDKESSNTRFAPLDFAISQKLLPLINGTSNKYKNLVDRLSDFCSGDSFPISNGLLEKIKKFGDETQYYQFFIR